MEKFKSFIRLIKEMGPTPPGKFQDFSDESSPFSLRTIMRVQTENQKEYEDVFVMIVGDRDTIRFYTDEQEPPYKIDTADYCGWPYFFQKFAGELSVLSELEKLEKYIQKNVMTDTWLLENGYIMS